MRPSCVVTLLPHYPTLRLHSHPSHRCVLVAGSYTARTTWTDADRPRPHAPSRRTRRGELAFCPHVPRAPARPRGSHRLSRRRAGRHSVRMGRFGRKGAAQHAVYCRWVSVREPDCMRVPRQGPHGGGAVRCYTGNVPMRHAFCTRARCGVRELRAGVDPVTLVYV